MEKFYICGGKKLNGELEISTSKNAVLPILAGCILCDGVITIHKFPKYEDTKNMLEILEHLGAIYTFIEDSVVIDCTNINGSTIPIELANKIRSSIFSLGSILSRQKKAKVAYPGGCNIGARPIDLHIKGLKCLGVKIIERHGYIYCNGENMKAGTISLDFPSVGATENIMLASVYLKGKTKIINCAKEPEIVDLANFLNKMGAKISGAGTSTIIVEGVKTLKSTEYTPIGDRIIAGTYVIATCMCGGKVTFHNVNTEHIYSLLNKLENSACKVHSYSDKISISAIGKPNCISKIETRPFPGFPTDLQPQIIAMLSVAKGTSIVVENLFESRFRHISELKKLGADIITKENTAIIKGVNKLYGAEVNAFDLRGGAGAVLAGLISEGYTTVNNIHHIDRGYYEMEKDLQKLGAEIERITTKE